MLQEALETGKQEWQNTKEVITTNRDVIIFKQTQVDTEVSQQTDISKEKAKMNSGKDSLKEIKFRAKYANGYIRTEEEEYASDRRAQEIEQKERQDIKTNFIIRGIRDYGKNESTLNLTRDFLKEKLHWKGQICQERRVGRICEERP